MFTEKLNGFRGRNRFDVANKRVVVFAFAEADPHFLTADFTQYAQAVEKRIAIGVNNQFRIRRVRVRVRRVDKERPEPSRFWEIG